MLTGIVIMKNYSKDKLNRYATFWKNKRLLADIKAVRQ